MFIQGGAQVSYYPNNCQSTKIWITKIQINCYASCTWWLNSIRGTSPSRRHLLCEWLICAISRQIRIKQSARPRSIRWSEPWKHRPHWPDPVLQQLKCPYCLHSVMEQETKHVTHSNWSPQSNDSISEFACWLVKFKVLELIEPFKSSRTQLCSTEIIRGISSKFQ